MTVAEITKLRKEGAAAARSLKMPSATAMVKLRALREANPQSRVGGQIA